MRCAAASEIRLPRPRCTGWRSTGSVPPGRPRTRPTSDPDEIAEITRRLDRLDGAAAAGPWTRATLALIATQPGVVSTTLAETLGHERFALKTDIRKLKRLGLTLSLEVGYELSAPGPGLPRRHVVGATDRLPATTTSYQGPTALSGGTTQAEDRGMRTTRLDVTLGVV